MAATAAGRDRARRWARAERRRVLDLLGGACAHCGFSDARALQVDHVNGDGYKHRAREKSQSVLRKAVEADPTRFQLLCANCNWIKRVENDEQGGRRGEPRAAMHYGARTHCEHGHPFDASNTLIRSDGGRRCRACKRARRIAA